METRIDVEIGYRIENGTDVKYFGDNTDNGYCYKDTNAWNNGGVIYICENALQDAEQGFFCLKWTKKDWLDWVREEIERWELKGWNENFVEELALSVLQQCDWQELSTRLNEVDIEEYLEEYLSNDMVTLCVQHANNNINSMIYDLQYTYSQMCMNRTPLNMENPKLYNHIQDLIDDFITDYELDEEWADTYGVDVDYIFEKLLD